MIQFEEFLSKEESETFERKQTLDKEGICKSMVAFANDLHGKGRGIILVGQAPNKSIVGLRENDDEVQRIVVDWARNNCSPSVPVSVECFDKNSKRLAFVSVPPSIARPHFVGKAMVRMGSTNRAATDAEIILLRRVDADRKVALLKGWFDEGKTTVLFWHMPARGEHIASTAGVQETKLLEVNADWIVLELWGGSRSIPYVEFNVGWEPTRGLPQIRYHGGMG